jgi:hypothetical protein
MLEAEKLLRKAVGNEVKARPLEVLVGDPTMNMSPTFSRVILAQAMLLDPLLNWLRRLPDVEVAFIRSLPLSHDCTVELDNVERPHI